MRPGLSWLTEFPVAHRGLHDVASGIVENTMPAFEAAVARGFAIELDVQESADGEAMVFHDHTLDRLTVESGDISARDAATLKAIAFKAGTAGMPTLAAVLDTVAGKVPVVIEIKSDARPTRRLEGRVVECLAAYVGPVAIQSFDPDSLKAVRALNPALPRGIISSAYTDRESRANHGPGRRFLLRHMLHAPATKPHFVAYHVKALPAAAPFLLRHIFGLPLLTWTVRTEEDRRVAARWADQMIFEGFAP